jgi:sugar fermentation stimulation protein A
MDFDRELIAGRWMRRYKRFLLDVELDGGGVVTAHCANPGSMMGCGAPGARVMLSHRPAPHRRLAYSLELVRAGRVWAGVNTALTNRIAAEAMVAGLVPRLRSFRTMRREVTYGNSRFDFLLEDPRRGRMWVEVKNVTLAERGAAQFPDAVTERGARHVRELAHAVSRGSRAAVLFIVQRADVSWFEPAERIDPVFAAALAQARRAGVMVEACACTVSPRRIRCVRRLPVRGL